MPLAYLYRAMSALAPRIPRRVGLWLFGLPAPLVARLAPSRHAVRDNLRHVLGAATPESEVRRLVPRVYRNQLMNYFDMFAGPGMRPEEVERSVRLVDDDETAEALAVLESDEGCVVVAPHVGSLDLSARLFTLVASDGLAVVEHLASDPVFQVVCDLRRQDGLEIVSADRAGVAILRALRRGHVVFLAADRDTTDSSVPVDLFGHPTMLPDGYAQLALRTGAPIVVAASARRPGGQLEIRCRVIRTPPETGGEGDGSYGGSGATDSPGDAQRGRAVRALMRQVLGFVEERVREDPDQWVLFTRVWPEPIPEQQ
ncbi:MAG: lysophospholipid acyltransferase family protein [Anaerolineae bacterium]